MFRYGKYLIVPLLSNNSNRGRAVSSDIFISSTGYLGYAGALEPMVIPGTNMRYVPYKIRSSGYSDYSYGYPNGSWYTMLPKVNAIDDLVSRIIKNHRHFNSFYNSGQMITLKAKTINNVTKDVRYNIDFSILDQYSYQNTFQTSFIHIFPYTSTGVINSGMFPLKLTYDGTTIDSIWDYYTTDSLVRVGGWCTYFAIKIFS